MSPSDEEQPPSNYDYERLRGDEEVTERKTLKPLPGSASVFLLERSVPCDIALTGGFTLLVLVLFCVDNVCLSAGSDKDSQSLYSTVLH